MIITTLTISMIFSDSKVKRLRHQVKDLKRRLKTMQQRLIEVSQDSNFSHQAIVGNDQKTRYLFSGYSHSDLFSYHGETNSFLFKSSHDRDSFLHKY